MNKIKISNDFFNLPDGQELFYRSYHPQGNIKAWIILVHGLAEHLGRYDHFANYLAEQGYGVYLYDQRGHGKTPGPRCHVESFQVLVDDLTAFIRFVKNTEFATQHFYVMGHSFGGQVVVNYLTQHTHDVDGAILSSPNVKLALEVSCLKRVLGTWASILLPALNVPNDVDASYVSHDPAIVKAYQNDPLVSKKISLRFGVEILDNLKNIMDLAPKIKTPCLVFQGEEDKITSHAGTEEFYRKMKVKDRQWISYPGFYHETLNEIGKEKVYANIIQWLDAREAQHE